MDVACATLPPALDHEMDVRDGTTDHGGLQAEHELLSSSGTEDMPGASEMDNDWRPAGWSPRPKRKRHEQSETTASAPGARASQPRPNKAIPIPGEPDLWVWDEVSLDRVCRWIECGLCAFRSAQGLIDFRLRHLGCTSKTVTAVVPESGNSTLTSKPEPKLEPELQGAGPSSDTDASYLRVLARSDIVKQSMYLAKELYEMLEPVIVTADGTFPVFVTGGDCWTFQATNHENRASQHFVPPRRWKPFLLAHQLNIGDALLFRVGVHAASVEIKRRGGHPPRPFKPARPKPMDVETAISVVMKQGGLTETDQTVLRAIAVLSKPGEHHGSRVTSPTQHFDNASLPALVRSSRNISGFLGVTQIGVKWQAQSTRHGRAVYIGTFDTPEEAAVAYAKATTEWDGAVASKSRVRRTANSSHCEARSQDPQSRVVRRLTNADVSGLMFYVNKPLMQIFQGESYKAAAGTPDRDTINRFQVVDEEGVKWPLEVKVYSNNHNRYLGREPWKSLIAHKHLSVNDTLSFHREDATIYMQIFRNGAPLPDISHSLCVGQHPVGLIDRTVDTRTQNDRLLVPDMALGREKVPIECVNGVDQAPPPSFVYVNKFVTAEGVHVTRDPADLGFCCDCVGDCSAESCRCMTAYDNTGRLLPLDHRIELCRMNTAWFAGVPIVECSLRCGCSLSCPNRVTQRGIQLPLQIFRTSSRGWGLRCKREIQMGEFICAYIGEIITNEMAEERGRAQADGDAYLFDLDLTREEVDDVTCSHLKCIDAREYGNAARFINHSCSPNLCKVHVFTHQRDPLITHVALFALRDISPGEELAYDYEYLVGSKANGDGEEVVVTCHCGSSNCRGRLI